MPAPTPTLKKLENERDRLVKRKNQLVKRYNESKAKFDARYQALTKECQSLELDRSTALGELSSQINTVNDELTAVGMALDHLGADSVSEE